MWIAAGSHRVSEIWFHQISETRLEPAEIRLEPTDASCTILDKSVCCRMSRQFETNTRRMPVSHWVRTCGRSLFERWSLISYPLMCPFVNKGFRFNVQLSFLFTLLKRFTRKTAQRKFTSLLNFGKSLDPYLRNDQCSFGFVMLFYCSKSSEN